MSSPGHTCANCGHALNGPWCAQCGQKRARRLELGSLVSESLRSLSDLDSTFLRTVIALSLRPGQMARDYLAGRRKPYLAAFKYAFIATTVLVITINLFDLEVRGPMPIPRTEQELSALHFVHSVLAYLIYVIVAPSALIQRALFARAAYNFAETYVFQLYVFGHVTWATVLFALTGWINTWPGLITLIGVQAVYVIWAVAGLYASARFTVLLRAALIALAEHVLVNVVAWIAGNLFVRLAPS